MDALLESTESLYTLSSSLVDRCVPEPEPPTEQVLLFIIGEKFVNTLCD